MPGCFPAHVSCAALLHLVYKEHRPTQASQSMGELSVGVILGRKKAEVLLGCQGRSFPGTWPQWDRKMVQAGFPTCLHFMGCVFSLCVSIYSILSSLCQPISFLYSWLLLPCGITTDVASLDCFPHSTWCPLSLCLHADWLITSEYSFTLLTG